MIIIPVLFSCKELKEKLDYLHNELFPACRKHPLQLSLAPFCESSIPGTVKIKKPILLKLQLFIKKQTRSFSGILT